MCRDGDELSVFFTEEFGLEEPLDEILLDKNGEWWHNDTPFTNKKIIDFFNRSICRTSEGTYVLQYDRYIFPIIVEDAPVFVTGVRFDGFAQCERIFLNLSTGQVEELNIESLVYRNSTLYCMIGDGSFMAKFKRSPAFHILDRLDESNGHYFLNICGRQIPLKQES